MRTNRHSYGLGLALALVGLLALVAGCASTPRLFVNRQADMTLYQKIAVITFTNLSGDGYASARVTRAFVTEMVIADRFQILDPSLMTAELERNGGLPDANGFFDLGRLRDAAGRIDATAVIRGGVTEYAMRRAGAEEYPVVSFDAEMIDVATGNIIWRISVTETGKGRMPIIGGGGERTFARVTEAACEHAVRLLREKAL